MRDVDDRPPFALETSDEIEQTFFFGSGQTAGGLVQNQNLKPTCRCSGHLHQLLRPNREFPHWFS